MDSITLLGLKNTLAEYMILSGLDNRPPMLDKDLYDSWKWSDVGRSTRWKGTGCGCTQYQFCSSGLLKVYGIYTLSIRYRDMI
ncbi:hypothetical protein Tco_1109385 [Tanacetum coccineum]